MVNCTGEDQKSVYFRSEQYMTGRKFLLDIFVLSPRGNSSMIILNKEFMKVIFWFHLSFIGGFASLRGILFIILSIIDMGYGNSIN